MLDREIGLAVRVIVDGTWGFASHAGLTPDIAAESARHAVGVAVTLAALNAERIELADEPVYRGAAWVSDYRIDPFTVPTAEKVALLGEFSGRLLAADGVDHVSAMVNTVKEQTFYADTFGSRITQQRVRTMPALEAVASTPRPAASSRCAPWPRPPARGWEALAGDDVWNWSAELAELPGLLAEKTKSPGVAAGPTDLVIDPTNLWLTIHESIGHATEYDRAALADRAHAIAARAGLVSRFAERRTKTLTGHLQQAEAGDLADLYPCAVHAYGIAQPVFDVALIALWSHVDEVDDDESAEIAQAQLTARSRPLLPGWWQRLLPRCRRPWWREPS